MHYYIKKQEHNSIDKNIKKKESENVIIEEKYLEVFQKENQTVYLRVNPTVHMGKMFFLRYIFTVLKFVQFPVKWAFFRIFCTKSNTKQFPIFILDFTLVIYLTRCYTMPVKQLQNYFRKEYRRIFQWLILSSGLASREENGHTL